MTRKKFVKQLMAMGFSRNAANTKAFICLTTGESYAAYYRRHSPWWRLGSAARQACAAVLNMTKAFNGLIPAARELTADLVAHHPQPITPENLEGGKVYLVTRQEHDRLHGYSANVSYVDELHDTGLWPKKNPHLDDGLDALSYTARVMSRGGGGHE